MPKETKDGTVNPLSNDDAKSGKAKATASEQDTESKKHLSVIESYGYTIGETLGSGSYATVKTANSKRHNCKVAIKIISKRKAPQDFIKKFLPREIEVIKMLRHSNIISFYQSIETTSRVYLVMELAEGGDVLGAIRREKYIDEPKAARWFLQMLEAVDYCHKMGVVHRDLKCENLLLDLDENLKLTDFGFARAQMQAKNGMPQLSDTFCGSYAYASPEILRGMSYEPQLADLWSMGVILFVMVFGRLPFDDRNHKELIKQTQNPPKFPESPEVSEDCKQLITRILVRCEHRLRINEIKPDKWVVVTSSQTTSREKRDRKRLRPDNPGSQATTNQAAAVDQTVNETSDGRSKAIKPAVDQRTMEFKGNQDRGSWSNVRPVETQKDGAGTSTLTRDGRVTRHDSTGDESNKLDKTVDHKPGSPPTQPT